MTTDRRDYNIDHILGTAYLRDPPGDWARQGACIGEDQDLWFPDRGAPVEGVRRAKEICATCPVQMECREYGKDERYGIWGGLSRNDRIGRRTRRRAS